MFCSRSFELIQEAISRTMRNRWRKAGGGVINLTELLEACRTKSALGIEYSVIEWKMLVAFSNCLSGYKL